MFAMSDHRLIEIPDPALVVLVGAAGAGKSTFAARQFRPDEVLSSDDFRARISGDPADQTVSGAAFSALHRELSRRLGAGRLTVVDATNVQPRARRALLARASDARVPAIAIILALPAALVLARNAARPGRVVPEDAVRRQLADLERTLAAGRLDREGFAEIARLTEPAEVDAVRVVRVRP